MARGLGLAIDLAVKVAVIGLSLYPLLNPESSHFAGKAMGVRALIYPVFVLLIPAVWLAAGRPRPYPVLADIALGLPFVIDAGSNVLGLFAIPGFDALPHAVGWFCLSIAFGLAVAPLVDARWVAFLLVVGFGASIDILWEIGEYLLMRSGSSGLALTYENTIQDLATSFIGGGRGGDRRRDRPVAARRDAQDAVRLDRGRRARALARDLGPLRPERGEQRAHHQPYQHDDHGDGPGPAARRPPAASAAERRVSGRRSAPRRREREPLHDLRQEDPGDALGEVAGRCRRRSPPAGCARSSRSRTRSPRSSRATAPTGRAAGQRSASAPLPGHPVERHAEERRADHAPSRRPSTNATSIPIRTTASTPAKPSSV